MLITPLAELSNLRVDGFAGTWISTIASVVDGVHALTIDVYEFPDGSRLPYVVASEQHADHIESELWPLSEVVHLLINVGSLEAWRIIARGGK